MVLFWVLIGLQLKKESNHKKTTLEICYIFSSEIKFLCESVALPFIAKFIRKS